METAVRLDASAKRIFIFEEIYPSRAAQEQAEKRKLDAFGKLARLNPFDRPKIDTVALAKSELRYEPFWSVSATRQVDYIHESVYPVQIANAHALKMSIGDCDFEVVRSGGKGRIQVPVREHCHRKIEVAMYLDGIRREIKPALLQNYVEKYKALEVEEVAQPKAVVNQLPFESVFQIVKSRLASEAIDAHVITSDEIQLDKFHLFYRPVFAFEFAWTTSGKVGVIEIDGLTGEAEDNGEWMRDKIDKVMTREMLFSISGEVAGALIPGGGTLVRVIDHVTRSDEPDGRRELH